MCIIINCKVSDHTHNAYLLPKRSLLVVNESKEVAELAELAESGPEAYPPSCFIAVTIWSYGGGGMGCVVWLAIALGTGFFSGSYFIKQKRKSAYLFNA